MLPGSEALRPGAFRVEGKLPPAGRYHWALVVSAPGTLRPARSRHDDRVRRRGVGRGGRREAAGEGRGCHRVPEGTAMDESVRHGTRPRRRRADVDSRPGGHRARDGRRGDGFRPGRRTFRVRRGFRRWATACRPARSSGGWSRASLAAAKTGRRWWRPSPRRRRRSMPRRPISLGPSGCSRNAPSRAAASKTPGGPLPSPRRARPLPAPGSLSATTCCGSAAGTRRETRSCCARPSPAGSPRSLPRSGRRTTKARRCSASCAGDRVELQAQVPPGEAALARATTGVAFEVPGRADPIQLKPDHIHDAGVIDSKTRALPLQIEVDNRDGLAARRTDGHGDPLYRPGATHAGRAG